MLETPAGMLCRHLKSVIQMPWSFPCLDGGFLSHGLTLGEELNLDRCVVVHRPGDDELGRANHRRVVVEEDRRRCVVGGEQGVAETRIGLGDVPERLRIRRLQRQNAVVRSQSLLIVARFQQSLGFNQETADRRRRRPGLLGRRLGADDAVLDPFRLRVAWIEGKDRLQLGQGLPELTRALELGGTAEALSDDALALRLVLAAFDLSSEMLLGLLEKGLDLAVAPQLQGSAEARRGLAVLSGCELGLPLAKQLREPLPFLQLLLPLGHRSPEPPLGCLRLGVLGS